MYFLAVGEKYPNKIIEGMAVSHDESGFTISIGFPNLKESEVEAFKNGKLTFSASRLGKALFLITEIEGFIGISDVAFDVNLTENKMDEFRKSENENVGYKVEFLLVDTATGILKGIRVVGISQQLSNAIYETCEKQLDDNFDVTQHVNEIMKIQQAYPTKKLYKDFSIGKMIFE